MIAQHVDLDRIGDTLSAFPVAWLPGIAALLSLNLLTCTLKWKLVLETLGQPIVFGRLLRLFWAGLFFNTFLPGRTGGDAVRAYGLPKMHASRSRAITSIVVDRALNLLALVLICTAATLFDSRLPASLVMTVWGLAGFCTITIAVLCRKNAQRMLPERLSRKLSPILSTECGLQAGALIAGLALASQVTVVLVNLCVARALGTPISTSALFVAIPLAALITAVPISINGVGIREAAYATLLSSLGASAEHGIAISVVVTAANIGWSLLGGVVYVIATKWGDNETSSSSVAHQSTVGA